MRGVPGGRGCVPSVVGRSAAAYVFVTVLFLGAGEEFFLLGLAGFGDSAEGGMHRLDLRDVVRRRFGAGDRHILAVGQRHHRPEPTWHGAVE